MKIVNFKLKITLPFSRFKVSGPSMEPAFKDGDRVIINRPVYLFSPPKTGDIVAVKPPKDRPKILLKKIKKAIREKQYSVVGINPTDSYDSRFFGPVSKEMIIGRVWFNY